MIRPAWLTIPAFKKPALGKPAVAAVLFLLLAAEVLLPGPAASPVPEGVGIPAGTSDQTADTAIGQWGDTILARPLFNNSRRPGDQVSTNSDFTMPRLSAIIVIGGTRSAIFAPTGDKPTVVAEGGEIGPYRVAGITPDSVQLLGPNGMVTLRPQFVTPPSPAAVANTGN